MIIMEHWQQRQAIGQINTPCWSPTRSVCLSAFLPACMWPHAGSDNSWTRSCLAVSWASHKDSWVEGARKERHCVRVALWPLVGRLSECLLVYPLVPPSCWLHRPKGLLKVKAVQIEGKKKTNSKWLFPNRSLATITRHSMVQHAWDFSPNSRNTKAKSVMNSFTGVSVCF